MLTELDTEVVRELISVSLATVSVYEGIVSLPYFGTISKHS